LSRKTFDQTLEFIRDLDRARSAAEVSATLLRTAGRFGFEYVLAGTIPMPNLSRRQQKAHIVLDHWPSAWTERYFAHGYLFRDPAIKQVLSSAAPFAWSELESLCRDDPAAKRVMNEAGDFRLKTGFTVPLMTLEGETAGFSLAGEKLDMAPGVRGMLTLLATYALGRTLELRGGELEETETRLTRREQEALQWAAEGKNEGEIGEIMNISEHGVDKHMRSVRQKLGTRSRTHAVAEAIRRGLIR
jgi:LuxR family quorum sensing-dependent transcriptional regulator